MKGMTCQTSRDSWLAVLKSPTSNSSAQNTNKTTYKLDPLCVQKIKTSIFQMMSAGIFMIDTIQETLESSLSSITHRAAYWLYTSVAYLLFDCQIIVLHPPPQPKQVQHCIALRGDNYSAVCQMNNFICLTTKYKPQVLHDNPENQAEFWPQPQNKHLSKQMDLVFKMYHKQTSYGPWMRWKSNIDKELWNLNRNKRGNFSFFDKKWGKKIDFGYCQNKYWHYSKLQIKLCRKYTLRTLMFRQLKQGKYIL